MFTVVKSHFVLHDARIALKSINLSLKELFGELKQLWNSSILPTTAGESIGSSVGHSHVVSMLKVIVSFYFYLFQQS